MPARKKSGFTLIELLVVIAIIAILAAILFPVFARAREAARKSTCQSNLKECAIALQLYYNDYDATLPSSVVTYETAIAAGGSVTAEEAQKRFVTISGSRPRNDIRDDWEQGASWAQLVYSHMKNRDIVFCPSDGADHHNLDSEVSYWWKFAADRAWTDPDVACQKEGDFVYNSDQIIFYEHRAWHFGSLPVKNNSQINVAFLDTHVDNVNIINSGGSDYDSEGEPMYYNFYNEDPKVVNVNPPAADTATPFYDPRYYSDQLP